MTSRHGSSAAEGARPGTRSNAAAWAVLGALVVLAMTAQLYSTAHGAGVSPDSTRYLAAASNFASGKGLVHLGDDGGLVPLRLWPPAYPVALSIGTKTVEQAWSWGRILNALLFGANVAVLVLLVRRSLSGRWVPALVGTALLMTFPDIVEIHAWIWSEPLTILAGSLSLLWIDRFLETQRVVWLVLAALAASIAVLTRYAAVAYVVAGALGLLLFDRVALRNRMVRLGTLLLVALTPVALWAGREGVFGGDALSRGLAVNERGFAQLASGLAIVSDWFLPGRLVEPLRSQVTIILSLGWLGVLVWCLAVRARDRGSAQGGRRTSALPEMLAAFIVAYSFTLIAVRLFVSPGVSISPRIFSLGLVALVLLTTHALTLLIDRLTDWLGKRPAVWPTLARPVVFGGMAVVLAFVGVRNLLAAYDFARKAHQEGLGYAEVAWGQSPVIGYLQGLPPDVAVVTNGPDAVYFLTGRPARMLPAWPGEEPESGPFRPEGIAAVKVRVQVGDVLVYFRGITWRPSMTEREVKRAFALTPLVGNADASAYRVDGMVIASWIGETGRSIHSSLEANSRFAKVPSGRPCVDIRMIERRRILA